MESVLMDPTVTATVIGVLLTVAFGAFAFAIRWVRSDIRDLRSDMRSDMNGLRVEVNDRFTAVETRITTEVSKLETKVDALGFKLDGLIMALANSGSLTHVPTTIPSQAVQPMGTETTPPAATQSSTTTLQSKTSVADETASEAPARQDSPLTTQPAVQ